MLDSGSSGLTLKYWTSLERLGKDKHSSLYGLFVRDEEKKSFMKVVPAGSRFQAGLPNRGQPKPFLPLTVLASKL